MDSCHISATALHAHVNSLSPSAQLPHHHVLWCYPALDLEPQAWALPWIWIHGHAQHVARPATAGVLRFLQ